MPGDNPSDAIAVRAVMTLTPCQVLLSNQAYPGSAVFLRLAGQPLERGDDMAEFDLMKLKRVLRENTLRTGASDS
jgi:hypothetical protein